MPSPIIQQYLDDKSIDVNKRRALFQDLENGVADENEIEKAIKAKYGEKYVPQEPKEPGALEKAGGFLAGLGKEAVAGAQAAGGAVFKGIGNTIGTAGRFLDSQSLASKIDPNYKGFQLLTDPLEKAGKSIRENAKGAKDQLLGPTSEVGEGIGEFVGDVAAQVPGLFLGGAAAKAIPKLSTATGVLSKLATNSPKLAGLLSKAPAIVAEAGIGTEAVTASKEGRLASPGELALGIGTDAALRGGGALLSKLRNFRAQTVGIGESGIDALTNPQNTEKASQFITQAKSALKNPDLASPLTTVGQSIRKDYKDVLLKNLATIGTKIDDIITSKSSTMTQVGGKTKLIGEAGDLTPKFIDITPAKKKLVDTLIKLGAKIDKAGKLDFSETAFASNDNARRQVERLAEEFLNKNTASPKVVWNKLRDLAEVLKLDKKSEKYIGDIAQKPLKDFKNELGKLLTDAVPEVKDLFSQFSTLADARGTLSKITGESKNLATLTRGIISPDKPQSLIDAIQTLSKVSGKDYTNEAVLANAITSSVNDFQKSTGIKDSLLKALFKPKEGAAKGLVKEAQGKGILNGLIPKGALSSPLARQIAKNPGALANGAIAGTQGAAGLLQALIQALISQNQQD